MAVRGHQRTRFTQCIIACQLHNQSRYGQQGILKSIIMAQPLELKVPQIHSTCLNIPYPQPIHHLRKMLYFLLIVAIKLLYCAPCTKERSNTMPGGAPQGGQGGGRPPNLSIGGASPPPTLGYNTNLGVPKSPLLSLFCNSVHWLKPHNNVNSRPPNLAVLPPPCMHVLDVLIIYCLQNPNVRANYS